MKSEPVAAEADKVSAALPAVSNLLHRRLVEADV
jgi:hypothetical protein